MRWGHHSHIPLILYEFRPWNFVVGMGPSVGCCTVVLSWSCALWDFSFFAIPCTHFRSTRVIGPRWGTGLANALVLPPSVSGCTSPWFGAYQSCGMSSTIGLSGLPRQFLLGWAHALPARQGWCAHVSHHAPEPTYCLYVCLVQLDFPRRHQGLQGVLCIDEVVCMVHEFPQRHGGFLCQRMNGFLSQTPPNRVARVFSHPGRLSLFIPC